MPNTVLSFFDVNKKEHLKAYAYLNKTGYWPNNFLPEGIEMPNLWQVTLAGKLADAYLKSKLGDNWNA